MNNFDHAIEATETALNSAGSAARENSRYMEGLEAKTQAVKASFQELANSVIDSGLVKGILDLANGFLQLLNTPIGNFITQMILLTGVFWGGTGLIKAMKLIPSFFSTAATAISGFTGVLSLTAPQLMLVAAGISAILAIAPAISNWWKEFTGDVEYLNEKIGEYSNQLSTNKDRLKDLLSIPVSSRTEEIDNEIAYLQMENEELEKNIRLYKEKVNKSSLSDIRQDRFADGEFTGFYELKWIESGESLAVQSVQSAEEAIAKLKEWGYEYEGLGNSLEDFGIKLEKVNETVSLTSDEYLTKLIQDTKDTVSSFENVANASEEEKQSFIDTYNQIQAYADTLQYASENGEVLSEAEKDLIDYAKELENGYSDLLNQMYPVEDSLERLASGAALNANEFTNFVSVYPDLIDALEESDGLYKINQESLYNLAAQGNETARLMVNAQIEITQKTIEEIKKRIIKYQEEISVLRSLVGTETGIFGAVFDAIGTAVPDMPSGLMKELEDTQNFLTELKTQTETWDIGTSNFPVQDGSSSSSSSKETDPIKEQSDNFKEYNENFEHYIFLREKQGASIKELISLNKEYQNQLKKEADWFRSQGVSEDSEYIRDLQKDWWGIQDTVIDLQRQSFDERLGISENYIEEKNELDNWGADNEIDAYQRVLDWMDEWYAQGLIDYEYYSEKRVEIAKEKAKAEKEAWEEALSSQIEELENQQSVYEKFFSFMTDKIDEQINKLQEQRDKEEEYWDNKIQALEDQNDEIERQIELEQLQQNLAKANQKNLFVYKDGKFQYVKNVEAISEAESELEAYEREEALRQEVKNLEKLKEEALDAIDDQIDGWEEYKEQWSSVVDDYQEEQDRLLIEQELGIKLEGNLWQDRLDNLSDYITQYKDLMSSLTVAQNQLNAGYSNSDNNLTAKGETILDQGNQGKDWSQVWWDAENAYQSGQISKEEADYIKNEAHSNKAESYKGSGATFNPASGKWQYASGTLSAHGGLSLVGEKGPELRVLNQGDGIIPANATKNLLELSKYSIKDILASKGQAIYSYMFDKLVLPNVTDFNSFVNELKRFKQFAYQQ